MPKGRRPTIWDLATEATRITVVAILQPVEEMEQAEKLRARQMAKLREVMKIFGEEMGIRAENPSEATPLGPKALKAFEAYREACQTS